ncbi:putative HNH endonuclease [Bacillus phage vB_BsuM-Goe10]|nr:putative HNH endonuclease [Bacillus phage vB_BsuM-Goe10]QMV48739.1 putative HNH endonuclease [Bacillus phage vB_BsuM-Goe10]
MVKYTKHDSYAAIHVNYKGRKIPKGTYDCLVDLDILDWIISLGRALVIQINKQGKVYFMYKKGNKMKWLHRSIMGLKEGDPAIVDHINRNPSDNRRCNLRIATRQINSRNATNKVSKHGYKWVAKNRNKYAANVRHNYQKVYLGNYDTPLEAHRVANRWVHENIGSEFCVREPIRLN